MKTSRLRFIALWILLLPLSCKEKRELSPQNSRDTSGSSSQTSGNPSKACTGSQTPDPKYGKLDMEGFPIDPRLGMNSNKLTKEQRFELRQQPPKGYQVGQPIVPRCVTGKAKDVTWRKVADGSFNLVSEDIMAKLLGLDPSKIPPIVRGAGRVLKSPTGGRVIVHLGGTDLLFEAKNGTINVSSEKKVHCVNFDDKRRAFILWDSFASESLIIGHLADDEDIEDLPSRQILYTYDIDKMILRRVTFPKDVQKNEWKCFVIEDVAPSAVLLRWDGEEEPMTVYLDQ